MLKARYQSVFIITALLWLGFSMWAQPARAESYSAAATSPVFDMGQGDYGTIDWTADVPAGTSVVVEVRVGSALTPDDGWTAWTTVTDGEDLSFFDGNQFIQHRTTLGSDGTAEPTIYDLTINYTGGYLLSSAYDIEDTTALLTSLFWTESSPGTSDVRLQLRTSVDGNSWTPWCGPDDGVAGSCDSDTYFTDPNGAEKIDSLLSDGSGDNYVQYRVFYTATGSDAPSISDVNLQYSFSQIVTRAYAGVFTSQVVDLGQKTPQTVSWNATLPAGTSLSMRLRAGTTQTPDGSWTAWTTVTSGINLSAYAGSEFFQYEATLSSDGYYEPSLNDVTFTFAGGFLISSPYNSEDTTTVLNNLSWTASEPGVSDVNFQLRTSADGVSWTPWCGPDDGVAGSCSSITYFTDPSGSEKIDDLLADGIGDKFVQYKVLYAADGTNMPSVSDLDIHYAIDSAKARTYAGVFSSQVVDLGVKAPQAFGWNATVPIGTSLTLRLRAGATRTPDANWTDWMPASDGMDLTFYAGKEYFQYEATLSSDGYHEPSLNDVTFTFAGGFLISSPYNSEDTTLAINNLSWTEVRSGSSDVNFQLRTSADGLSWTPWCGPDDGAAGSCSSITYFTDPSGGEKIDDLLADGIGDKFVQYKVLYAADGSNMPSVSSLSIHYAIDPAKTRSYAGVFTSSVIEGGREADYVSIDWNDTVPIGTSLVLKLRAGDTSTPDGSWTAWSVMSKHASLDGYDKKRYLQYEVDLSSDGSYEPSLAEVTISVQDFLISSPYNTENNALVVSKLTWAEDPVDNSGGSVRFQLSTSPDGIDWTPWCGPDNGGAGCDSSTYFTDPLGRENIDEMFTDGVDDQFLRYMVSFVNVVTIPTISSIDIQYVANTAPVVAGVVADQDGSGLVQVAYRMSDADESVVDVSFLADVGAALAEDLTAVDQSAITVTGIDQLPTAGTIQIDDEQISYAAKSGSDLVGLTRGAHNTRPRVHPPGTVAWIRGSTVSGDVGAAVAIDSSLQDKTGVWDLRKDLAVYYAQARIRVNVNDGNGAYQIGNGDSASFLLDTRPPLVNSLTIDGRKAADNIALDVSDEDAHFVMKYSTLQADLDDESKAYVEYAPSATISLGGDYVVYFRFKDDKSNLTDYTLSLPEKIKQPLIQDVSNLDSGEYRLFFSFAPIAPPANGFEFYHIYAADSGSGPFSELATQDRAALNYYMDATLAEGQTRYYQACASDQTGNYSECSAPVYGVANGYEDGGEGNGSGGNGSGNDQTPPVITHDPSLELGALSESGATLTFTTDENSDSVIQLSTDGGESKDYGNEQGAPTFIPAGGLHTVTLVGLRENTTYYYRIVSHDASGNRGLLEDPARQHFTTLTDTVAPLISGVTAKPSDTQAVISFITDEGARSRIDYGLDSAYGLSSVSGNLNTDHQMTLTGLNPNSTYHYQVSATDGSVSANRSTSSDLTFTTLPSSDLTPPAITAVHVSSITYHSATITFTTDENSSSLVDFGLAEGSLDTTQGASRANTTAHSVTLVGLDAETAYFFQAKAVDAAGNAALSVTYNFTTSSAPVPPSHSPQLSGISINNVGASSATISWSTDIASDSIVGYSLDSGYGQEQGSSSLTTSHSVTLSNLSASTTYNLKLKSREAGGELGEATTLDGQMLTITTLAGADTASPVITFDEQTGVSAVTATRATITFATDEFANSLVDYSKTAGVFTSTAGKYWDHAASHSVTLSGLEPETTYYFQLRAIDGSGNEGRESRNGSGYSFTTLASSDKQAPIISGVNIASPTANSATVSWTTDEPSSSLVDFGTSLSFGRTQGSAGEMVTSHSVTLTGLSPATSYLLRVKSADENGNLRIDDREGSGYAFTTAPASGEPADLTAPLITFDPASGITNLTASSVVISWTTDEPADSTVGYGLGASFSQEQGSPELTLSHRVILTNLSPGSSYRFQLKSSDAAGNLAIASAGGAGYTFTTPSGLDRTPPVISSVQVESVRGDGVTLIWSTDENSSSLVEYGTEIGHLSSVAGNYTAAESAHSVSISGLPPLTRYYFRVRSVDQAGNQVTDSGAGSPYIFTTLSREDTCPVYTGGGGSARDVTPPSLTQIKISALTADSATLGWTSSEAGYSLVEYGLSAEYGNVFGSGISFGQQHAVQLSSLRPATTYHCRALSADASGNLGQSADLTFTTLLGKQDDQDKPSLKQQVAEQIKQLVASGLSQQEIKEVLATSASPLHITSEIPQALDITNASARISWTTDKEANSIVRFRVRGESSERESGDFSALELDHAVLLGGLESGLTYEYQVQSSDPWGVTSRSAWHNFTTSITPSIYDVAVSSVNLSSAVISWKTNVAASSQLQYGTTISYGDSYQSKESEKATDHLVKLSDLLSGKTYHYRIRGVDAAGNTLSSADYTLTTFTLPRIEAYAVAGVEERGASLRWTTNVPADATVRYTDLTSGEVKTQGEDTLALTHVFSLKGLEPGRGYLIQVQGRDAYGNQAVSGESRLETPADTTAPSFGRVSVETTISSGKSGQVRAIISYATNEPASTRILYQQGTGSGGFSSSTPLDGNLTTNHIVVITDFQPASVYRFRIEAVDQAGNRGFTKDYTVLVPEEKKSVIQMITSNFENTFGWLKRLGG